MCKWRIKLISSPLWPKNHLPWRILPLIDVSFGSLNQILAEICRLQNFNVSKSTRLYKWRVMLIQSPFHHENQLARGILPSFDSSFGILEQILAEICRKQNSVHTCSHVFTSSRQWTKHTHGNISVSFWRIESRKRPECSGRQDLSRGLEDCCLLVCHLDVTLTWVFVSIVSIGQNLGFGRFSTNRHFHAIIRLSTHENPH